MSPGPGGATRVACVLGHPVAHTLSPAIHNAAFSAAGLDWVYVAFDVGPAALPAAVDGLRALRVAGASITMPHKQSILPLLDEVSDEAARIGAVNAVAASDERLHGFNTDGAGFVRFCERDAGIELRGLPTLLLGAGGAARALAVALGSAGALVRVAARRPGQAAQIAALAAGDAVAWEDRDAACRDAGLIVNATPIGSDAASEEGSALRAESLRPGHTVVDLVYAPADTPLLARARTAGATGHNGIGMLVHQAALAFETWTGLDAPEAAMAAAAHAALGPVRR